MRFFFAWQNYAQRLEARILVSLRKNFLGGSAVSRGGSDFRFAGFLRRIGCRACRIRGIELLEAPGLWAGG